MRRNSFFLCILLCSSSVLKGQTIPAEDSLLIIDSTSFVEAEKVNSEQQPFVQNIPTPGPVILRSVPDSVSDKLKRSKNFEYANDPAYWVRAEREKRVRSNGFWETLAAFFARPAVQAFVYILIILVLLFLLVRVVIVNRLFIFRRTPTSKKVEEIAETDEEMMSSDLDPRIAYAVAAGDQRSAVRLLYLKTLQLLDKKGWIRFHPKTTNNDYRKQAGGFARGKDFSLLSNIYEYVYYGNFQMTAEQFKTVLHNFNHFHNTLRV